MLFNIVKFFHILDDHVANPAYLLVLVTGLTMAWWHWTYTIHWIHAAIVLYVIMRLFGLAAYSPALTRQIGTLERDGPQSASCWSPSRACNAHPALPHKRGRVRVRVNPVAG